MESASAYALSPSSLTASSSIFVSSLLFLAPNSMNAADTRMNAAPTISAPSQPKAEPPTAASAGTPMASMTVFAKNAML